MQDLNNTQIVNTIVDKALISAFKKANKETNLSQQEIYNAVLARLNAISKSVEGNINNETHLSTLFFGW